MLLILADEYVPVMIQKNDKSFLVCTLSKTVLQQPVELELNTAENVSLASFFF